jgi:hemoglobin-like flavoprotein
MTELEQRLIASLQEQVEHTERQTALIESWSEQYDALAERLKALETQVDELTRLLGR